MGQETAIISKDLLERFIQELKNYPEIQMLPITNKTELLRCKLINKQIIVYSSGSVVYHTDSKLKEFINRFSQPQENYSKNNHIEGILHNINLPSFHNKIYYAHSMMIYDTIREKEEISAISNCFPNFELYNPSELDKKGLIGKEVMEICLTIVKNVNMVIFSEYEGSIGRGVYDEILEALKYHKPVRLLRKNTLYKITEKHIAQHDKPEWKVHYGKVCNLLEADKLVWTQEDGGNLLTVEIFFDGASRGNPGLAGAGWVIKFEDTEIEGHQFLGNQTNNHAEYTALILALKQVIDLFKGKSCKLMIYGDSKLVIDQLKGNYSVNSANISQLFTEAVNLLHEFQEWVPQWIPREKNQKANELASNSTMKTGKN